MEHFRWCRELLSLSAARARSLSEINYSAPERRHVHKFIRNCQHTGHALRKYVIIPRSHPYHILQLFLFLIIHYCFKFLKIKYGLHYEVFKTRYKLCVFFNKMPTFRPLLKYLEGECYGFLQEALSGKIGFSAWNVWPVKLLSASEGNFTALWQTCWYPFPLCNFTLWAKVYLKYYAQLKIKLSLHLIISNDAIWGRYWNVKCFWDFIPQDPKHIA